MAESTALPRPYAEITGKIGSIVLAGRLPRYFWWAFFGFFLLMLLFLYAIAYLIVVGIGKIGVNIPVAWGTMITNVVWWIGIGHAGTLISAVLLLFRQHWRASINRFAEAMTLLAVAMAGLFPILHLGWPWFFYWLLPLPNTAMHWPQWRSPLVWDFAAIATYITVSLLFWYMGLIPDLAVLRDRAKARGAQLFFGILALGWRGSAYHWKRHQTAYYLLAALATPLVVSVHSVVSLDFTVAIIPGYHSTVFPPYFVAGALYSGFAMVLTIAIPLRAAFDLDEFITLRHIDNAAKVLLASGLLVAYGYLCEAFFAWYSGSEFERYMMWSRLFGPYAATFYVMLFCNVGLLQLLWFSAVRRNAWLLFAIAILINVGMWLERFLHHHMAFTAGSHELSFWLGTVNTGVLLTSSLTMMLAELSAEEKNDRRARILLLLTIALGTVFVAIKLTEYREEFVKGLVPFIAAPFRFDGPDRDGAQLFFDFYFAMTGLHALHLAGGGLVIAAICWTWSRTPHEHRLRRVSAMALYWHFVDVVWVFLYPVSDQMTIETRNACLIWMALLLLLVLTAASSQLALGWANAAINLAIAAAKALLILIVFMGLRRDDLLPRLAAFGMLLWLAIMYALALTDYVTR